MSNRSTEPIIHEYTGTSYRKNTNSGTRYVYRPLFMIGLSHKDNKENIICLVDSGADNNLFPADFGRRIGLKIEDGKPGSTAGITDEKMVTYKHKVKLWVNEKSFYVPVDFCDGFNHATPLLGQKGFFDLFNKVVFKKEEKIFELH